MTYATSFDKKHSLFYEYKLSIFVYFFILKINKFIFLDYVNIGFKNVNSFLDVVPTIMIKAS